MKEIPGDEGPEDNGRHVVFPHVRMFLAASLRPGEMADADFGYVQCLVHRSRIGVYSNGSLWNPRKEAWG